MILVLLGTGPAHFTRLLDAVDKWAQESGEEVVAQCGHTPGDKYEFECHAFVDHDVLLAWINRADVVIAQGGFGSLKECLRARKPTVAVPRDPRFFEDQGDQTELVDALENEGWLVALKNMDDLGKAIQAARELNMPSDYTSDIPRIVANEINNVLGSQE
ncbi:MAG: hypothetical protein GXP23_05575 [Gammaproteobacteria bacterium]|nr:hypothetical protein [Gammaproteobacteria bacterium]